MRSRHYMEKVESMLLELEDLEDKEEIAKEECKFDIEFYSELEKE